MRSLAETQGLFRRALSGASEGALRASLVASGDVLGRLEIYQRHHRESFRRHLRGRYPTLEWLVGTPRMIEFADETLKSRPPQAPSLAEYGAELIDVVAAATRAGLPPYLADVARLDWHLGRMAVAVSVVPMQITALAGTDLDALMVTGLRLQDGTHYLQSEWPVDRLVHLRLGGNAPDRLEFLPQKTWLELSGARGAFSLLPLEEGDYAFRRALFQGRSLGAAAERALAVQPAFDLSAALSRLFADGRIAGINPPASLIKEETDHD